jgi:hypothetical protein
MGIFMRSPYTVAMAVTFTWVTAGRVRGASGAPYSVQLSHGCCMRRAQVRLQPSACAHARRSALIRVCWQPLSLTGDIFRAHQQPPIRGQSQRPNRQILPGAVGKGIGYSGRWALPGLVRPVNTPAHGLRCSHSLYLGVCRCGLFPGIHTPAGKALKAVPYIQAGVRSPPA